MEADEIVRPFLPEQERGRPGQEDEDRCAEVRYPTGQEERRIRDIAGIDPAGPEEVAHVVEGHHEHHEAAQRIEGVESLAPGCYRDLSQALP